MAVQFAIVPVIVIGLILAVLEMIFVHKDEAGMHWLTHAIHAIPTMFVFIFISMNVVYVLELFNVQNNQWITIGVRVGIGIIAMAKIAAAAAVAGKVGEKFPHTLTIAVLIMAAPFIWESFLCTIPFIQTLPMNGCPALK